MQARQLNREQYFNEQSFTTVKYVIPYISEVMPIVAGLKVAEIGCGEGGNLKPFLDLGCTVVGIDLSESRIENAKRFFNEHPLKENLTLMAQDIYDVHDENLKFDLIIMRDTIEHIPNQEVFMEHLKKFLNPKGIVFFAFPPWRMPFGGHQQLCKSKFLSKLPYFHILPYPIYRFILKAFGESDATLGVLMEIKDTRISTRRFHKIVAKQNFKVEKETYYFINPNYEVKFKLKPRELFYLFNIPYFRDFFATALYSIVSLKD